jgi:hypothetical protein
MHRAIDALSDAALDALRRGESDNVDDPGFAELARVTVAGAPLALRGELGGPAWFVTFAGLGLAVELGLWKGHGGGARFAA